MNYSCRELLFLVCTMTLEHTDFTLRPLYVAFVLMLWLIGDGTVSGCDVNTTISLGVLCGTETATEDGTIVHQYLGVPYAQPPTGDLRLEYPEEVKAWTVPLSAVSLPPACPQTYTDYIEQHFPNFTAMSEDCLYLNIYVPQLKDKKHKLPVFFWIHGGSNEVGMGAMLPGETLAALGEIIVVNINYRLDVLGFLTLEDEELPGNLGILDQILALQWVQKHIEAFSGDPTRVTLAGHSAGALDVGVIMLSPLAKGLFENVIIQSGSAISFWSTMTDAWRPHYRRRINQYFKDTGCLLKDSRSIKKCLKQRSVEELQYNEHTLRVDGYPIMHPVVIDKHVLHDQPIVLLRNNQSHGTSVMMGFTRDEGMYLLGAQVRYESSIHNLDSLRTYLHKEHFYDYPASITDVILHEYIDWRQPRTSCWMAKSSSNLFGDRSFSAPIHMTADILSQHQLARNPSHKVFIYSFQYKTQEDNATGCDEFDGVPHGNDIFYLFGVPINGHGSRLFEEKDKKMSKVMIEIWSNFVKNGRPSHHSYPDETFQGYDAVDQSYFRFTSDSAGGVAIEQKNKYKARKMVFWNSLIDRINIVCDTSVNSSSSHKQQRRMYLFIAALVSYVLVS